MAQQAQTVDLPKRLPLVIEPANRDETTAKDAKLVNCYVEKSRQGEYHIFKRPGLLVNTTKTGNGRGVYNWRGNIYSVFGTTIYKDGTSKGTVDGTNGVYQWSSCLGATPKLQFGNGVKAYNYDDANGLVLINDADFPTAFVKGWAYLDGTTYVMTAAAAIQGSDLNDPVNWQALNTITAQIEPDQGVALGKQLVYVVAFKQWTTEIFYDAANATGSPLGRVQGARVNWGCASQDSVQDIGGALLWAGTTREAGVQVIMMDGVKAAPVSTKPVERLLDNANWAAGNVFSWSMQHDGHRFYGLTIKDGNLTLVYDLGEQMWHQWTDSNGNYFPIVASTFTSTLGHIMQHETNGKLYLADTAYVNDDGSLITVDIYPPNFDGGTHRQKHLSMMEFVADQTPGSILQVRKNDHDYDPTRWSNFRNVDLSKRKPALTNCGTFIRRAHDFRHRCNTTFRMQAVDLQMDLCTL